MNPAREAEPAPASTKFTIGRSDRCHLVICHGSVSQLHASLTRIDDDRVMLRDEGSTYETFLDELTQPIKEDELHDDNLVFFSENYRVPGSVLLRKFRLWEARGRRGRSFLNSGRADRFTKGWVTIGSKTDQSTDDYFALGYLDVWPRHAVISRRKDESGYSLRDYGGGCFVDGRFVRGDTVPLQTRSTIKIGGVTLSTSFEPAADVITIDAERRGFFLTAEGVSCSVEDGGREHRLLDDVGFTVMRGEFVGLLGASGSGKTTLLNCLGGIVPADGVCYDGVPLAELATVAGVIGYVPQDDVLPPELTVRETLFYSARLRLDHRVSNARIRAKIEEVCETLRLYDPATNTDVRDTQIGSPADKRLSGGQKKRVNLALELLTDPLVLLLDEPTSGLSSGDTRMVMDRLRDLADTKGIPIVITIHQPSAGVYRLFDRTLYLKAGRLVWFGPAADSVGFFAGEAARAAGPDVVMEIIDGRDPDALRTYYEASPYAQKLARQRARLVEDLRKGGKLAAVHPTPPLHLPGQVGVLTRRQLKRRWRDPFSLALQFGQAPALGFLVGAVFSGRPKDTYLNHPLFLLCFIAIWFGTNATARELVSERVSFRREQRGGVSPAATLLAKLVGHGLLLFVQCALLLLAAHAVLRFDFFLPLGIFVLWMCGMCGAALGLRIGARAKTEVAATTWTPVVLIPLILLGGALPGYDNLPRWVRWPCQIMPSRLGYEAMVLAEMERGPARVEMFSPRTQSFARGRPPRDGEEDPARQLELCLGVLALEGAALTAWSWTLLRRAR